MNPTLIAGDYVLVFKPTAGGRIFNIFKALKNEKVSIKRLPGFRHIRHNDILVFNFPYPESPDSIHFNVHKYYIKRCIGLPGDTLSIVNGFYLVNGQKGITGNQFSQKKLSRLGSDNINSKRFRCQSDSLLNWNIKDFGPLYIPQRGDSLPLTPVNLKLYGHLIAWEQKGQTHIRDSQLYIRDSLVNSYRFEKDYYFMGGDNVENSEDSRYWGLLPEEFIVGKTAFIWKSVDGYGNWRWDRFLKKTS